MYKRQVRHLAAEHAIECGAAAEQARRIRFANPFLGAPRRRKEDLQRRVDAEQVREALKHVAVERRDLALLPLVERRLRDAEQRRLLRDREIPRIGETEEGAQRGGKA